MRNLFTSALNYVSRRIGRNERNVDLMPKHAHTHYESRAPTAEANIDARRTLIDRASSTYANGRPVLSERGETYRIYDVSSGIATHVRKDRVSTSYLETLVGDAQAWAQAEANVSEQDDQRADDSADSAREYS